MARCLGFLLLLLVLLPPSLHLSPSPSSSSPSSSSPSSSSSGSSDPRFACRKREEAVRLVSRGEVLQGIQLLQSLSSCEHPPLISIQLAQVLRASGREAEANAHLERLLSCPRFQALGFVQVCWREMRMIHAEHARSRVALDTLLEDAPVRTWKRAEEVSAAIHRILGKDEQDPDHRQQSWHLKQALRLNPLWRSDLPSSLCDAHEILAGGSDLYLAYLEPYRCLASQGRVLRAVRVLHAAVAEKPDWAWALNELGAKFGFWQERGRAAVPLRLLEAAVALEPQEGIYVTNLALAHQHAGQLLQALQLSRSAARLLPSHPQVWMQLGRAAEDAEEMEIAVKAYRRASLLDPREEDAFCSWMSLKTSLCSWSGLEQEMEMLQQRMQSRVLTRRTWGGACDQPFRLFPYPVGEQLLLHLARHVVEKERSAIPPDQFLTSSLPQLGSNKRLRVAYMSSDFGSHTVGMLVRGLLDRHDLNRMQLFAANLKTPGDLHEARANKEKWRETMRERFELWVDLELMDDSSAALALQRLKIHVLVDLNGHSKGSRSGILLRRPAPVIVNFLGQVGGGAAGRLSCFPSDKIATPPELTTSFTEKLLFVSPSYLVNDHKRLFPRPFPRVADEDGMLRCGNKTCLTGGGGERKMVLANFGQMYKIDPSLFLLWCDILREDADTILWLLEFPPVASKRIRRRFLSTCRLPPSRLVFSAMLPLHLHVPIKSLADLALDTLLFNGHSTGLDTLWAGVPIVTVPGDRMHRRAGASMAHAAGATVWLARNERDYLELARRCLRQMRRGGPAAAAARSFRISVSSSRLFDMPGWTRRYEASLRMLWEMRRGKGNRAFNVIADVLYSLSDLPSFPIHDANAPSS
ncbi:hypothetical protein GUITHDRAFT_131550 [Guillardia theta CCMP2712]|uniref:protein O-GlcNAc transferase n=1 Tax=Guillardia theta (strain CCMP2712) TaxID=905079 RepID=L1K433_GUITC|nr:hypothetical protein GUITHDRAFT_131550 [Guillardia theta CCMP2712]EKX55322.1 hypothetical protein GUITHDRAFT_131550 [Guillardia theta CCMP2712]|eukprot:XP_005842302.1 hypothetical protein GUITHDRAFT_131550 [Guillardia theta CCMP2712]